MYKTIEKNISAELIEKKSKFIANIFYIESKEEAEEIIKNTNKKYHDARHNCYAYRVFNNEEIIEKSSDDGEPSGTAGAPMLTIISKNNLINILVIVTRYFGGILLGTGGLVKAYSDVTKKALENAKVTNIEEGYIYEIDTKYSDLENLKYFIKNNEIKIQKEEYFEHVYLEVFVPKNKIECLKNERLNNLASIKRKKIEKTYMKNS